MRTFEQLLDEAERTPIRGWDFKRLGTRISTASPPWDFERIVEDHARRAAGMLDMGTGGGEWLASLAFRPPRTVATEAWPPNIDVATARLRPLGITVVAVEAAPDNAGQRANESRGRLPFPIASFDLVTNRHESFLASEVARVVAPDGVFLTQQTGGNYADFHDALGLPQPARADREWNVTLAREQLTDAGLEVIDSAEGAEATTFADVGALAWYLRAVPWVVEGFSFDAHGQHLARFHERIQREGPVTLRQPSFWVKAVKAS